MDTKTLKEIIVKPEYDFLRTNEHIKDSIIFLTLGGSYAYGTNLPNGQSDVDIRGCALNSKTDILGLTSFEQVIDNNTDTTVYSFNKLVRLLMSCNPNCIELLGGKPEHYIMMTDIGRQFIDNRKIFLSKECVKSFGGYAYQQLNRLNNAMARNRLPQSETEKHILNSCQSAMLSFSERYKNFDGGSINIFIDKSENKELDSEIFADVILKHYPVRDYKNMFSDLNNIIKDYGKLNKRNNKKDDAHLNKHAMHLIRLYLMCIDILEKGEIITFREADHDLLMSIRNGKYMDNEGRIIPEFYELLHHYEERLDYAKNNTSLPAKPDFKTIQDFVMEVNKKSILLDRNKEVASLDEYISEMKESELEF